MLETPTIVQSPEQLTAYMHFEVERSEIRLPDGPLRVVGDHQIELHLHADVNVEIKVVIEAAEAENA